MSEYVRQKYGEILDRLQEPRMFIQVLAGPRQVGKTTLVRQVLSNIDIPYVSENADFADPTDTDWIRKIWQSARMRMKLEGSKEFVLVIDEIQKLNNWSEAVKREWDDDTRNGLNIKLLLLGSSRLLLKNGLTESLAGRFELIRVGHWSYQEMHDAFGWDVDKYIYYGGYPGPAAIVDNEKRWRRYIKDSLIAPSIEKDVIMTSNIYKPALMKQVFDLGCSYSGELLSLTKIIGQLQDAGNATTVANYINILDECNLLAGLQKYAMDDARKYNSIPKFQVYNNALLTAFKGRSYATDRVDTTAWGRWVESAIGTHLLSQASEYEYEVFYWKERSDEVDFIIKSKQKCIAIEVKSGRRGTNKGLPLFEKTFHPDVCFVVGTNGIDIETFLKSDIGRLF